MMSVHPFRRDRLTVLVVEEELFLRLLVEWGHGDRYGVTTLISVLDLLRTGYFWS